MSIKTCVPCSIGCWKSGVKRPVSGESPLDASSQWGLLRGQENNVVLKAPLDYSVNVSELEPLYPEHIPQKHPLPWAMPEEQ